MNRQLSLLTQMGSENKSFRDFELDVDGADRWNPNDFGETPRQYEGDGQGTIFWDDSIEPPDPDDYDTRSLFDEAWQKWESVREQPQEEPCTLTNVREQEENDRTCTLTTGHWIEEKKIKRGNKEHGPYLYERWRGEDGKLKSKYLGKKPEHTTNSPASSF